MGPVVLDILMVIGLILALLVGIGVAWTIGSYFFGPPFIRLLVNKYLARRKIAWIALASVALCSALVLIVLSVMGGWLNEFKRSYKKLSGDLVISAAGQAGFANYEEMIVEIEKLPEIAGAIPIIQTVGIIEAPAGWKDYVSAVGIPMDRVDRVFQFTESLWFQSMQPSLDGQPPPRKPGFERWTEPGEAPSDEPGIIVGSPVLGIFKNKEGRLEGRNLALMRDSWLRLTVVPDLGEIGSGVTVPARTRQFPMVDAIRTQSQLHDNGVYVPFEVMQRELRMNAARFEEVVDPIKGTTVERIDPARTSEIHINVKPGVNKLAMIKPIDDIVKRVGRKMDFFDEDRSAVQTWEKKQERFLGAIEFEITLTTMLYVIVSIVAVLMIFCIFYAVVAEKLKDIGIVKSVGATGWHVTQVFLAYGAAVGFVGGLLGVGLGTLIIKNLNLIERVLSWLTGRDVWDPRTYALDLMPDRVDINAAYIILITAVVASTIGAVVPAMRAGRLKPVEALRYE
jgi:lipoprotein-releasing system permease protein